MLNIEGLLGPSFKRPPAASQCPVPPRPKVEVTTFPELTSPAWQPQMPALDLLGNVQCSVGCPLSRIVTAQLVEPSKMGALVMGCHEVFSSSHLQHVRSMARSLAHSRLDYNSPKSLILNRSKGLL